MLPSIRDINLNTDPHSKGALLQDIQVCAYGGHSVVERPRGGLRARGRGKHARAEAAAHAAPNGVQSSTINHVWRKNMISFLYFLSKKPCLPFCREIQLKDKKKIIKVFIRLIRPQ